MGTLRMTQPLLTRTLVAGLQAFDASGLARVAPRSSTGVGAVLTFHHVRPARRGRFQPNRHLEITPEFLGALVADIRASAATSSRSTRHIAA